MSLKKVLLPLLLVIGAPAAATSDSAFQHLYCAKSFGILLEPGEQMRSAQHGAINVFTFVTRGRMLAIGEGENRIPPRATLGTEHDLRTMRLQEVVRDGRMLGYFLKNPLTGSHILILGTDFSSFTVDRGLLNRFDVGLGGPTCSALLIPKKH